MSLGLHGNLVNSVEKPRRRERIRVRLVRLVHAARVLVRHPTQPVLQRISETVDELATELDLLLSDRLIPDELSTSLTAQLMSFLEAAEQRLAQFAKPPTTIPAVPAAQADLPASAEKSAQVVVVEAKPMLKAVAPDIVSAYKVPADALLIMVAPSQGSTSRADRPPSS
jgi:hypothetical protein